MKCQNLFSEKNRKTKLSIFCLPRFNPECYVLNSVLKILSSACPANKYDYNCTGTCDCIVAHTTDPDQSCDLTTGACKCLATWTGTRCETDVDECIMGTDDCNTKPHTNCSNFDGGFECLCIRGYKKNAQGNCEGELEFDFPTIVCSQFHVHFL